MAKQPLADLPLLSETPMLKREQLFRQKLQLCCTLFDFEDPSADVAGKEIKRETLVELAEYVNTPAGQKIFTEAVMVDIVKMVRVNLLRTLPPQSEDFDPVEDEPTMEIMWPHLQVVYEFFLRFVISTEVNGKVAKRYIDTNFIRSWIELFDAEDPRERDYAKTVLHRMYGKFMSYRSSIRRIVSHVFYRFTNETHRHNGITELLEILGSIINGFAIPLKKEHIQFLERALIPLHKPSSLPVYAQQLSYCVVQYVEKDPETAIIIVRGLIRCWPWTNATKQVMLLNELQDILELVRAEQLLQIQEELYRHFAACLESSHFQVVERTLYLWNVESLSVSVMSERYAALLLSHVYAPLSRVAAKHWNQSVENLAQTVLKMYQSMDQGVYESVAAESKKKEERNRELRQERTKKWESLHAQAVASGIDVAALVGTD